MVIELTVTERRSLFAQSLLSGTRESVNAITKEAMMDTALAWHRKYIKIHFTRRAYSLYGDAYLHQKRRGLPFVISGHFRDIIESQGHRQNIQGTSNQVRFRMKMGRPAQYTGTWIKNQIFMIMASRHFTYKQAARFVYTGLGYSEEVKARFRAGIKAVSPAEAKALKEFLKQDFLDICRRRFRARIQSRTDTTA